MEKLLWTLSVLLFAAFLISCQFQNKNSKRSADSGMTSELMKDSNGLEKIVKSSDEWKKILTPEQFRILRNKGTERAFTGKYWDNKLKGMYHCAACKLPLFESGTKFKSGTGWPSFYQPVLSNHITEYRDATLGMVRVEVTCGRCDGHLGHVFDDGPKPTGLRYCINSESLNFERTAK